MNIKLSILLFSTLLAFVSCKENNVQKSPEELKLELSLSEGNYPDQYITLDSVKMNKNEIRKGNLFRSAKYDGYKITGLVKNSATIAKYKDLIINVEIFSKTKSIISTQDFTFYEFYEPNTTKPFNLIVNPPEQMNGYNVYVKNATYFH